MELYYKSLMLPYSLLYTPMLGWASEICSCCGNMPPVKSASDPLSSSFFLSKSFYMQQAALRFEGLHIPLSWQLQTTLHNPELHIPIFVGLS